MAVGGQFLVLNHSSLWTKLDNPVQREHVYRGFRKQYPHCKSKEAKIAQRMERLAKLIEAQHAEARKRFPLLRPFLEDSVSHHANCSKSPTGEENPQMLVPHYLSDGVREGYPTGGAVHCV